jgi:hypothetical protein
MCSSCNLIGRACHMGGWALLHTRLVTAVWGAHQWLHWHLNFALLNNKGLHYANFKHVYNALWFWILRACWAVLELYLTGRDWNMCNWALLTTSCLTHAWNSLLRFFLFIGQENNFNDDILIGVCNTLWNLNESWAALHLIVERKGQAHAQLGNISPWPVEALWGTSAHWYSMVLGITCVAGASHTYYLTVTCHRPQC